MGLNDTPSGERIRISFFGRRNAGKSSLVNAITGQQLSVVSDIAGTTTDPVSKAMELLPLGPVIITDTAGYDDEGILGKMRVEKTRQMLSKTDIAVLVTEKIGDCENELISLFKEKEIPYITVFNKCDLLGNTPTDADSICVSAKDGTNIEALKELIARIHPQKKETPLVSDLLTSGDSVILVIPIDESAPKGRLILPQQQMIRDILDSGCIPLCCRDTELKEALKLVPNPKMVITDSQAFKSVAEITPENIPLTSFSILMARKKGLLDATVNGIKKISELKDGDKILISEGCTHHRQCGDIGSVKIPNLLKRVTGKNLDISLSSGTEFPENLSEFSLIIHCGGCMISEREMKSRVQSAAGQDIPITNYGTVLAYLNGILKRSLSVLPHLADLI